VEGSFYRLKDFMDYIMNHSEFVLHYFNSYYCFMSDLSSICNYNFPDAIHMDCI